MFDGDEEFLHGLKIRSLVSKPLMFIVPGLVLPRSLKYLRARPHQEGALESEHGTFAINGIRNTYFDSSSWSRSVAQCILLFTNELSTFVLIWNTEEHPVFTSLPLNRQISQVDFVMLVLVPKLWQIQKVIMSSWPLRSLPLPLFVLSFSGSIYFLSLSVRLLLSIRLFIWARERWMVLTIYCENNSLSFITRSF